MFSRNPLLLRGRAVVIIEKMCNGHTVVDDSIVKALSKAMINRFYSILL